MVACKMVESLRNRASLTKIARTKPMSKLRLIKNLLVLCFGFLFLFCAFQALANLQSTINSEEGLGVISQSIIYAFLILSSLFIPKLAIKKLGCKWTLVLSILMYAPYIGANFYPHLETFIPTAILVGIGAAPLWSAKCTYLNDIGIQYASYVNENSDVIISRFFGIFFMIFQNTQIWGNLVSYYVLKPETQIKDNSTNGSINSCGIVFCPWMNETNSNLQPPAEAQRYLLIAIYLSCVIFAAILVAIFLDPLQRSHIDNSVSESTLSHIGATLNHLKKMNQLLLVPLTIYSGIEQAYFLGDFTVAYIACSWGVYHVGYVFICYGVVNAFMSFLCGRMLKHLPRTVIMTAACLGNLAACFGMFFWSPSTEESHILFIFAGVWGFSDAIWQTQINAYYGTLFKGQEEAAFSNYRLWESVGFSLAFAYSKYLCMDIKIYILLCFLAVGMTGYFATEVKTFLRKEKYSLKNRL